MFSACAASRPVDRNLGHAVNVFRQYAHRFAVSRVFHGLPGFLDGLEAFGHVALTGIQQGIDVFLRRAGDHEIRRDIVLEEVLQHVRSVGDPILFEPEMLVGVDERRFCMYRDRSVMKTSCAACVWDFSEYVGDREYPRGESNTRPTV